MSTKQAGANSIRSSLLDDANAFPGGLTRISTPAFVYDEAVLDQLLTHADRLRQEDR